MATAPKPTSYAERWRQLEATLPPEQRSRTRTTRGRIRPYRPCPSDFREQYIEMGWQDICDHYQAHWSTVARWIDETGRQELRTARAAHVKRVGIKYLHPEK